MYEVLIVGSGVSGVAAALRFVDRGVKPCLIDTGIQPVDEPEIGKNFYTYRQEHDSFNVMVGENFEGLVNLDRRSASLPAKLTSPRMRFVTARSQELSPVVTTDFGAVQSFAQGGLANAWGAGLYRYTNKDLERFPMSEEDLSLYYDRLTEEIGISGEHDDLTPYFGRDPHLQKPLQLSANARRIQRNYEKKRRWFNQRGVFAGRPRLGVLSSDKDGRKACDYRNLEFWQPKLSYIYSPIFTLNRLIDENRVIYIKDHLVNSWSHEKAGLRVQAQNLASGEQVSFRCRKLVLAAGAMGSAKLALQSRKDYRTKLVLLDNPALQFPLIIPGRIGSALEKEAFGLTQLNVLFDSKTTGDRLQGSLLEVTSPSRAEFFSYFPGAAFDNLRMIKHLLPAVVVFQVFFPADCSCGACLGLKEDGRLEIKAQKKPVDKEVKKEILRIFRMMGAYSVLSQVVEIPSGHSIHYAGTLPMLESSTKDYTCSTHGELYGEPNVYVADGSAFPVLAAKNISFTMMANAMRVADCIVDQMRR